MLLRAILFFWLNNTLLLYAALHTSLPQDWAVAGDLNHLGLEWHMPSVEELQMTDRLLEEFLQPELDRLQAFMQGEAMDR